MDSEVSKIFRVVMGFGIAWVGVICGAYYGSWWFLGLAGIGVFSMLSGLNITLWKIRHPMRVIEMHRWKKHVEAYEREQEEIEKYKRFERLMEGVKQEQFYRTRGKRHDNSR